MGLNCLAGVGGGQGEGTQCNYLGSVLAWSLAQSTLHCGVLQWGVRPADMQPMFDNVVQYLEPYRRSLLELSDLI